MKGIFRGKHVVIGRTPEVRRQIQGTGHVQFSVDDLGAGIGHVHTHRTDRIVAEFAGHEGFPAFMVFDIRLPGFRFRSAGDGQEGQQGEGCDD